MGAQNKDFSCCRYRKVLSRGSNTKYALNMITHFIRTPIILLYSFAYIMSVLVSLEASWRLYRNMQILFHAKFMSIFEQRHIALQRNIFIYICLQCITIIHLGELEHMQMALYSLSLQKIIFNIILKSNYHYTNINFFEQCRIFSFIRNLCSSPSRTNGIY